MLPIVDAQKRIARIWIWGGAVVLIILIFQTAFKKYGTEYLKVIGWFSQNILPTWGIIIATLVYTQRNPKKFKERTVDPFYFRICRGISFFYFLIVYSFIFLQPVIYDNTGMNGLEVLAVSSYFLALLQGILNATLGIFFLNQNN